MYIFAEKKRGWLYILLIGSNLPLNPEGYFRGCYENIRKNCQAYPPICLTVFSLYVTVQREHPLPMLALNHSNIFLFIHLDDKISQARCAGNSRHHRRQDSHFRIIF